VQWGASLEGDATYFRQRASDERTAAMAASHPAARRAHRELAERYDDVASAIESGEVRLKLVVPASNVASR
jgi:hypothetical protein